MKTCLALLDACEVVLEACLALHDLILLCFDPNSLGPPLARMGAGSTLYYSILLPLCVSFLCFSIYIGHSKDDPLYDPKPPRKNRKEQKN